MSKSTKERLEAGEPALHVQADQEGVVLSVTQSGMFVLDADQADELARTLMDAATEVRNGGKVVQTVAGFEPS